MLPTPPGWPSAAAEPPITPAAAAVATVSVGSPTAQPSRLTAFRPWSAEGCASAIFNLVASGTAATARRAGAAAASVIGLAALAGRRRQQLHGAAKRPARGRKAGKAKRCAAVTRHASSAEFIDFVGRTGSPAHTVLESQARLLKAGFTELREGEAWKLEPGGRYFVTNEGTSIGAFAVGGAFDMYKGGVVIAAAHTDSPCLKLRPCSKLPPKAGTVQLGVDTYGGGLWHTWFDRPLGIAGKVVVATEPDRLEERLVHVDSPVCVIPNLAIHLQTPEERKAFAFNKETQLRPVLCSPCGFGTAPPTEKEKDEASKNGAGDSSQQKLSGAQHHAALLGQVAKAIGVNEKSILDVDLCLMDATPPCIMGDFVSTPRIDNVLSTWAAVDGLAAFTESEDFKNSIDISCAASFDHEEVGSVSASGADSAVLERWLDRVLAGLGTKWSSMSYRSFLLSCDCAHGLHPNYAEKHQTEHQPLLGSGVVIKTNANQRYATTPILAQMVRNLGKRSEVPIQEFVVRNDCPCGSTIGPLLSARLGVRTVDVGAPQWAMHSCRETAHGKDIVALQQLCVGLFRHFRAVDQSCQPL
mmetsp:Transcript_10840/g.27078  ORF Transcript_10840/g.27078 Transcript_10840/m.27078 type:complete len:584 (+) Transcript_10840:101-1852(+)